MSRQIDLKWFSAAKIFSILFVFGSLSTAYCAESLRLPKEFPLCKLSDPKYDECLKDASQAAYSLLRDGIPSLGVEPLDPLFVQKINVEQGAGAVTIVLSLLNSTLTGLNNVKVIKQSNNFKSGGCTLSGEVEMPQFTISSNYKISGKILLLPVKGEGVSNVTMRDVTVKAMMKCEKFERDGEEFLNITRFIIKMEPKNATIYLGNLFGGDEALGNAMNQLINENSRDIIRELSPAIASTFGTLFRDITNKIFHKVPHNTIFLQ